jgi:predicted dehydrogenase
MGKNKNTKDISLGLIGFGYWGPNLARNFSRQANCEIIAVCDQSKARLKEASQIYPGTYLTQDSKELFLNKDIDAILIATPVFSHHPLTLAALRSGKDVFLEKPLALNMMEGREIVEEASRMDRILAVDHTFLFTSSVQKIRELITNNVLGDLIYIDSVRVNLGLFQPDINVIFDLAPHDMSIATYLLGQEPKYVQAMGLCYGSSGQESVAYSHLEYESGLISHSHFSWLSPVKIRKSIVAGTKKMLIYDDTLPSEKIKIYDKGIEKTAYNQAGVNQKNSIENQRKIKISYRTGDMLAPEVHEVEALEIAARHFLDCVRNRKEPISNGSFGLKILKQIEGCQLSIADNGRRVELDEIN